MARDSKKPAAPREHAVVTVPHHLRPKVVIGWLEYVALPEWRIGRLRAKIDTGAHTSAMHVERVELVDPGRVRFDVVLARREGGRRRTIEADVIRATRVCSSTGHWESRYVVATSVRLGSVEKRIEITLASRDRMRYRMLLGRAALRGDFLIDASHRAERPAQRARVKRRVKGSAPP